MNSDKTKNAIAIYDDSCQLCSGWQRRFGKLLHRNGVQLVPICEIVSPESKINLPEKQLMEELHILLPNGDILRGGDACREILRHFWWGYPLYLLCSLPGVKQLVNLLYKIVARHRV